MKRIYLVLLVLYIKNSETEGTSYSSNYNKNTSSQPWYQTKSSISRDSYVDLGTQPQSGLPSTSLKNSGYTTSVDSNSAVASNSAMDYNSQPAAEASKYYYQIYPGSEQQQYQNYYPQPSNNQLQYPNMYSPDEASNKQSFLSGLNLPSLGNLGSTFGDLSSLGNIGSSFGDLSSLGNIGSSFGDPSSSGSGGSGLGDLASGGGSGLAAVAGPAVAGILGLKGLGGLGIVGTGILLIVLGPLLVVMIGFPIAMIVLGILAFPVLQLRIPPDNNPAGGARGKFITGSITDTARIARDVIQSEQCMERLSCSISSLARGYAVQGWISQKLEKSQNKWLHRVSRSFKTASSGEDCSQYICTPASAVRKMFRSYIFGEENKL